MSAKTAATCCPVEHNLPAAGSSYYDYLLSIPVGVEVEIDYEQPAEGEVEEDEKYLRFVATKVDRDSWEGVPFTVNPAPTSELFEYVKTLSTEKCIRVSHQGDPRAVKKEYIENGSEPSVPRFFSIRETIDLTDDSKVIEPSKQMQVMDRPDATTFETVLLSLERLISSSSHEEEPKHAGGDAVDVHGAEPSANDGRVPEPEAEQPEAEQPEAEQPEVQQPEAEQPEAEQPKAEQPEAEQLQAEQPKAEQPKAEQPKAECFAAEASVGDGSIGLVAEELDEPEHTDTTELGEALRLRMPRVHATAGDSLADPPDLTVVSGHGVSGDGEMDSTATVPAAAIEGTRVYLVIDGKESSPGFIFKVSQKNVAIAFDDSTWAGFPREVFEKAAFQAR